MLPHLDGRKTVAEIVVALSGQLAITETLTALRRYEAAGHLAEGRPEMSDEALAFWDAQGVDPHQVVAATAATELTLVAGPGLDHRPVLGALESNGLRVRVVGFDEAIGSADAGDGLTVVLVDDYLDPELDRLNTAYLAAGRSWLPAKPAGVVPWVGPFLRPGETGCWTCLAQRLGGNRQVERYLSGKRGDHTPATPRTRHFPRARR